MAFTPEELAEMAAADAEIEAEFCMTQEEIDDSRERDYFFRVDSMDRKQLGQRRYREANKEKIAEGQRRYREANKEKIAEGQRRYREANKEKIAEGQRRYYEANKDKISEDRRRYYEANKEKTAEGKTEIKSLRKRLGLTQHAFADLFGVTQSTVSRWENIAAPGNWREIVDGFGGLHDP